MGKLTVQEAAALAKFYGTKVERLTLGTCQPCVKKNAAKVVIGHLELDARLLGYWKENYTFYAYDPQQLAKPGDVVLVKELKEKKTTLITHELLKVIYPLGDRTCPLTGKPVYNTFHNKIRYRDDMDKVNEAWGVLPTRFKYSEAPPRGWQKDRRDFTYQDVYKKYDASDDSPYAIAD